VGSSPDSANAAADLRRIWGRVRAETRSARAGAVVEVELGFYEAARGTHKTIRYRRGADERELDLLFPPGIADGDRFQLPGEEDAVVEVRVAPRPADSRLVRAAAALGLVVAVSLLALVLLR
jgi:hypothetical protein